MKILVPVKSTVTLDDQFDLTDDERSVDPDSVERGDRLAMARALAHVAVVRAVEQVEVDPPCLLTIQLGTDPEAPIFMRADFGATVDLFELAAALEEQPA